MLTPRFRKDSRRSFGGRQGSPTLDDIEPSVENPIVQADEPVTDLKPDSTGDPFVSHVEPPQPGLAEPPDYVAPDPYTPQKENTVAGRMTGLLESGGKYIENARLRGREFANKRGLLNSSIAAGAAERSAIETALPIATADAGAFHEAGMAGYTGELESARAKQAYVQDVGIIEQQAKHSGILSKQESDQAKELEGIKQAGADARQKLELDVTKDLDTMKIAAGEKEVASKQISQLGETFSEQVRLVNSDPNISLTGKAAIIEDLRAQYEQNAKTVASMYSIEIDWATAPIPASAAAVQKQAARRQQLGTKKVDTGTRTTHT